MNHGEFRPRFFKAINAEGSHIAPQTSNVCPSWVAGRAPRSALLLLAQRLASVSDVCTSCPPECFVLADAKSPLVRESHITPAKQSVHINSTKTNSNRARHLSMDASLPSRNADSPVSRHSRSCTEQKHARARQSSPSANVYTASGDDATTSFKATTKSQMRVPALAEAADGRGLAVRPLWHHIRGPCSGHSSPGLDHVLTCCSFPLPDQGIIQGQLFPSLRCFVLALIYFQSFFSENPATLHG